MSDFGCVLIFNKKKGAFNKEDKTALMSAFNAVKSAYTFSPIFHDMTHELKDWVDQGSLAIILTEYYMDDDYDEIRDFAEEEDLEDAEIFIKKMKLPRGIDVEAQFLDW